MLYQGIIGLLSGLLGGLLAFFLARRIPKSLKNDENGPMLKGMPIPGRSRVQKRAPKANTDLMAYTKELEEQGVNRG